MKLIRVLFAVFVLLPLAAAIIVFAIHNRAPVAIDPWPLTLDLAPPLYILLSGVFVLGFLIGGLVAWLSGGRARGRARREHYRLMDIERKEAETKQAETVVTTGLPAIAKT